MADNALHKYHESLRDAQTHERVAQWELALRETQTAVRWTESPGFSDSSLNKRNASMQQGGIYRRFGHFGAAIETLDSALQLQDEDDLVSAAIAGEKGVIYLHQDDYVHALNEFSWSYNKAKQMSGTLSDPSAILEAQLEQCRAVGNIGWTEYHLALRDKKHLAPAFEHLNERLVLAQGLMDRTSDLKLATVYAKPLRWYTIALDRLVMCHILNKNYSAGLECGKRSIEMTSEHQADPTIRALSRLYCGHALLKNGRPDQAREMWDYSRTGHLEICRTGVGEEMVRNPHSTFCHLDRCTSAMALCKEPSAENCGYLRELIAAGVNLDKYDEQGYSALDYAEFSKHEATISIISTGLQQHFQRQCESRLREAHIRRHHREIFQGSFRSELATGDADLIARLRHLYAVKLVENTHAAALFDNLKYISFAQFAALKHFPRHGSDRRLSRDSIVQTHQTNASSAGQHIVFVSYRWLGTGSMRYMPGEPDDANDTQYRRMTLALKQYME